MKLKKFLAVLLALTCMLGIFAGCTDEDSSQSKTENKTSSDNIDSDDEWTKNY